MATLAPTFPTLLDQIKVTDPDGTIADVVQALAERNTILQDANAQEGNLETGTRVTIQAGLPTIAWRKYNQGVDPSKQTTIQVDETCGMMNGRFEVDCSLAKLNGNEAAFRASQEVGFINSMNISMASALFYASVAANPEKLHGWTPRYDDLTADNGENVVHFEDYNETGTPGGNDHHSIWFVTWGPETAYLIYPKGSQAGIQTIDMGRQYVEDRDGKKFLAWVTDWEWQLGLCVKDWRYHCRIAEIDPDALNTISSSQGDLSIILAMVEAYGRIRDFQTGRTVIYMNRTVRTWLDQQILVKPNVDFSPMEWHGHKVMSFRGIPIIVQDALDVTETDITTS